MLSAVFEEDLQLDVDLEHQRVITPGGEILEFEVDAFRKHCLLEGLDDIALTKQYMDDIKAFEKGHHEAKPFIKVQVPG